MEPRRLEGKWENEEPDTEEPLPTIKREMDPVPGAGSPEPQPQMLQIRIKQEPEDHLNPVESPAVPFTEGGEMLEGKWENEEPDTEEPLPTIKREMDPIPGAGSPEPQPQMLQIRIKEEPEDHLNPMESPAVPLTEGGEILEGKWENEEPDTEEPLPTIKREMDPVPGAASPKEEMEIIPIRIKEEPENHLNPVESPAVPLTDGGEMLEVKWENEEPDTEEPLPTIKREMDPVPGAGSPEPQPEMLQIKKEEPDPEDHQTPMESSAAPLTDGDAAANVAAAGGSGQEQGQGLEHRSVEGSVRNRRTSQVMVAALGPDLGNQRSHFLSQRQLLARGIAEQTALRREVAALRVELQTLHQERAAQHKEQLRSEELSQNALLALLGHVLHAPAYAGSAEGSLPGPSFAPRPPPPSPEPRARGRGRGRRRGSDPACGPSKKRK
ncbi:hypothetical protein XENTR_v10015561 [Xenopus tropicalis]|nr:hypothetical protein XENTR_v10015561 [Xenopus tropicalis]